jgi:hypothetical protein
MKIPYEFEQFVGCIYPGIPYTSGSLESLAAAALEHKVANERRVVLAFLNELLAATPTPISNTPGMCNRRAITSAPAATGCFSKSFVARSSPTRIESSGE